MVEKEGIRTEFSARLRLACDEARVRARGRAVDIQGALRARGLDATPTAIGKWLNAESMPGRANMLAIAEWLGVRVEWLQYGEGGPRPAPAEPARPAQAAQEAEATGDVDIAAMRERMERAAADARKAMERFKRAPRSTLIDALNSPEGISSARHDMALILLLAVVEASSKDELDERDFRVLYDTLSSLKAHKAAQDDQGITPIPDSLQGLAEATLDAAENGDPSNDMLGMLQNGIRKQQPKEKASPDATRKKRST